jgi:hypothetical protein
MVKFRCKDCIWWDPTHKSLLEIKDMVGKFETGYCRKDKPIAVYLHDQYWGTWPIVDSSDLCGEFKG